MILKQDLARVSVVGTVKDNRMWLSSWGKSVGNIAVETKYSSSSRYVR
jgi:hypothetical protein